MLQLSKSFYDLSVLSLRTGDGIGTAIKPIINPNNLKVEGWYAIARGERNSYVLPTSEVREIIAKGIVVNDHSAFTHIEDMVRLEKVIRLQFELAGKQVITETKRKLGKINDYAVDSDSMLIKKLYVTQSLLKNFSNEQLVIDRGDIVEITNRFVKVRDGVVRERSRAFSFQPSA